MISIIIPVYKTEPFLAQCIESVCNQTFRDLDIILVDDGSPDRCGEICDVYAEKDQRIRVYHIENRGHYLCREFALEKAREIGSRYIGFVDSDDWIEPDMFETLLRASEETGADIALCGFYVENPGKQYARKMADASYDQTSALCAFFSDGFFDMLWNKLYRIECFDGVDFLNRPTYCDAVINLQIYQKIQKAVSISAVKYHYRQVAQSIIHVPNISLVNLWLLNKEKYDYCSEHMRGKADDALFANMMRVQTKNCANAIVENWRWWNSHTEQEKRDHQQGIIDMNAFSKAHIPLFGITGWPFYLRFFSFFSHFKNTFSFFISNVINKLFILARKRKNVKAF